MRSGDVIHDRYRLEETLGSGGMAEVWRATDERLERSVAIKFPAANLVDDPEFMVRFFSEAQAVARLSHPNVVHVLDFGEHEGHSYLVMEHVPGGSLKDLIEQGPVDPARACDLICQAARAAGAAHAEGIVHRDIKPGNILLDEQDHVKLADFGIASTAVAERLTATGAAIGSPHYVSPEQASGNAAAPQSDVYALGVVLYELLTGERPIDADNIAAIAIAHVEKEPDPPRRHAPDLDPDLDALVTRCLDKDPSARFADGTELAAALEPFTESQRGGSTTVAAVPFPDEPVAADRHVDEVDGRRTWMIAAAALVAIVVIAALAFALTRPTEEAGARPEPRGEDRETTRATPRKRKPSPTVSAATAGEAVVPSPVASRSEVDREDQEASDDDDEEEGGDDEGRPRRTRKPPPRPRPSRPPRTPPPATPAASPSG